MPYKPAKLYSAKGDLTKEWYIEYYYLLPGQVNLYKRFKERLDINRRKTVTERLAYGRELVKFFNDKLAIGYNPFTAIKAVDNKLELKISSQLLFIKTELSNNAPSDYAISSYTENYNRLIKYIDLRKTEGYLFDNFDMEKASVLKSI